MTNLLAVIALCWYWECAAEPVDGQRAVMDVTWTRAVARAEKAKRPINPMDVFHVLVAPKQFSAVEKILHQKAGTGMPNDAVFTDLLRHADMMVHCAMTGESDRWKVRRKSTHYYAHRLCRPGWARGMKDVEVVGGHTFGRL